MFHRRYKDVRLVREAQLVHTGNGTTSTRHRSVRLSQPTRCDARSGSEENLSPGIDFTTFECCCFCSN